MEPKSPTSYELMDCTVKTKELLSAYSQDEE